MFEGLKIYSESGAYPFHMPGHKRNLQSGPLSSFYQYDITEIDGFDNLHEPEGLIAEAQQRAAKLYHSQETYFLINGSTAGILSAISAVADRGKKLLIARNCHKAVYHAAFLNHLELEYIYPDRVPDCNLADGINAAQIEAKLKEIMIKEQIDLEELSSLVAGVVITSPTYDGILSDVKGITVLAHRYGIPVIVDQAHGAHFGFHPGYPESAVAQGADLIIHSVHKTLPAPTQTAILHRNGSLTDGERLRNYLRIYQSSSPSYLLMAGIDSCMKLLEKEGYERLEQLLVMRNEFMLKAEALKHIRIYTSMAEKKIPDTAEWVSGLSEPGRMVITVNESVITGQIIYDMLREKYGLQMEMCGKNYVVAILSMMDRREGFDRLTEALIAIDKFIDEMQMQNNCLKTPIGWQQAEAYCQEEEGVIRPEVVKSLCDAFMKPAKEISLSMAEGEVVADFVNLYPPGIPLLVPGERIDIQMIHLAEQYLEAGYHLQGIQVNESSKEAMIRILC